MADNSKMSNLSRRHVLGCAGAGLVAGAAATLPLADALAAAKTAKTAVAYQDTPKGDHKCDNCSLFQAPDQCKSVEGPVSPQGWCKIWIPKKAG